MPHRAIMNDIRSQEACAPTVRSRIGETARKRAADVTGLSRSVKWASIEREVRLYGDGLGVLDPFGAISEGRELTRPGMGET